MEASRFQSSCGQDDQLALSELSLPLTTIIISDSTYTAHYYPPTSYMYLSHHVPLDTKMSRRRDPPLASEERLETLRLLSPHPIMQGPTAAPQGWAHPADDAITPPVTVC